MKYVVGIEEKLVRTVIIDAEDEYDASEKADGLCSSGVIDLDYNDFYERSVRCEREAGANDLSEYKSIEDDSISRTKNESCFDHQWICCSDRLPPVEGRYTVYDGVNVRYTYYNGKGKWFTPEQITHWMNLPEPPGCAIREDNVNAVYNCNATAVQIYRAVVDAGGCDATDSWSKGYDAGVDAALEAITNLTGVDDSCLE